MSERYTLEDAARVQEEIIKDLAVLLYVATDDCECVDRYPHGVSDMKRVWDESPDTPSCAKPTDYALEFARALYLRIQFGRDYKIVYRGTQTND